MPDSRRDVQTAWERVLSTSVSSLEINAQPHSLVGELKIGCTLDAHIGHGSDNRFAPGGRSAHCPGFPHASRWDFLRRHGCVHQQNRSAAVALWRASNPTRSSAVLW